MTHDMSKACSWADLEASAQEMTGGSGLETTFLLLQVHVSGHVSHAAGPVYWTI